MVLLYSPILVRSMEVYLKSWIRPCLVQESLLIIGFDWAKIKATHTHYNLMPFVSSHKENYLWKADIGSSCIESWFVVQTENL